MATFTVKQQRNGKWLLYRWIYSRHETPEEFNDPAEANTVAICEAGNLPIKTKLTMHLALDEHGEAY